LNTMMQIRQQIWQCFTQSRDALFELIDALTAEASARSLPEVSKASSFRRKWSSASEALSDGRIDTQRWSSVCTEALLANHAGPVWLSADATSMPRPEAETSPDRSMIYVCHLPPASKPVSVGWQFSTVMLLPEKRSSWGAILSQRRICHQQTAVAVGVEQV